ncbi:OmpA family protein [Flavicella sp.]|uniref:OmpA family protein n=1 Tax=Flavicella sp. TaxID=2957742 RepID=UPI00301B2A5B
MFKKNISFLFLVFSIVGLMAQDQECIVKNININTKNQDFGMIQYSDSLVLFSSSRKDRSIKNPKWGGNNQPYLGLYTAKLRHDGTFDSVVKFSHKINTKYHDANLVFSKDGSTVYFSRSNYFKGKYVTDSIGQNLIQLYKAVKNSVGEWEVLPMPFNSRNYQTGHPSLSTDQTKLYFISDMPGGYGETDVYIVDIHKDGTYGTPKNLGPNVNTKGKEMFPYAWKNELYFSSDGYAIGLGGLDIYKVDLEDHFPTESVVNLGRPLNSYSDDFGISFNKTKNSGYFSSNRPGGKGDDDIYTFERSCQQIIKGITQERETEVDTTTRIKRYTKEQGSIYMSEIARVVLDSTTVYLFDDKNLKLDSVLTNAKGEFQFIVDCSKHYIILAEKEHFEADELVFTTLENNNETISANLYLTPPDIINNLDELMIRIKPIYFKFDKSDVRPESIKHLQKVVNVMKKHPHIKVDIKAHTDSRGKADYNLKLSDRRAGVVRVWIIQNGINGDRITSQGYGESKLLNECSDGIECTDEQHQKNRRVEFVITNPEEHKMKVLEK